MKTITVTFEVSVERNANDMTEEELKKDVKRMLHVYGRSNGLCVENVSYETKSDELAHVGVPCRSFGCALRDCLRLRKWVKFGGYNFIDHCDIDTRNGYLKPQSDEP